MFIFILGLTLLGYVYQDADSLLVTGNDSLIICGTHTYNIKIHLTGNSRVIVRPWNNTDTTGVLYLSAPVIYIHDSVRVGHAAGYGYSGGTTSHPNGYGPGYGRAGTSGGGGGGGFGGSGGSGGDTNPGSGGPAYGSPSDTVVAMGSGGGAGRLSEVEGWGGAGAGLLAFNGRKIIIDTSEILACGGQGSDGATEAGGGGSGGAIRITGDSITLRGSSIAAQGGNGGSAEFGGGGGGGGGRIKVFYRAQLDTVGMQWNVTGGGGGDGDYGNGENGQNGTIFISPATGQAELSGYALLGWRIYPNPAGTAFTIQTSAIPARLEIFDIAGRVVKEIRLTRFYSTIDHAGFSPGVYFLKIHGNYFTEKLVIVR
jgi:hypothetical protein